MNIESLWLTWLHAGLCQQFSICLALREQLQESNRYLGAITAEVGAHKDHGTIGSLWQALPNTIANTRKLLQSRAVMPGF